MKTLMNCAVILTVMAILTSAIAQAPPANGRGGQRSPSGFSTNNSRPNCCDYKERPPVFFHEDWKEIPIATPITQDHVKDPNLILSLHGPGKDGVRKSHHTVPVDDPFYTFSGPAKGNWAVSLHHKNSYVDLTGVAKIRWRINVSGLRSLQLFLPDLIDEIVVARARALLHRLQLKPFDCVGGQRRRWPFVTSGENFDVVGDS